MKIKTRLAVPALLIHCLFFLNLRSIAQCGIAAKIVVAGGQATCAYFPDTSNYQSGWIGYKYEWKINDKPAVIASAIGYDQLGAGFNRIYLKVYGTNPQSGDSCTAEYTNIFQATGDAIYPEFDVIVNGNTVNFSGTFKGGSFTSGPSNISYDFGDGTQSTAGTLSETHTYQNAGTKTVYLYTQSFNPNTGTTAYGACYRNINVGTGAVNLELSNIQDNTFCDSVNLYVTGSPAFTFSGVQENFNTPNNTLINGSYVHVPMIDVPGHDFISISGGAANAGSDNAVYLVKLNDCGIIPDTVSGVVFNDLNYNGLPDPGEPGLAGMTISVSASCNASMITNSNAVYSTITDSNGYYEILVPHYTVQVFLTMPSSGYTLTYPQNTYYNVNYSSGTMHSGHYFGLSPLSVSICGRCYLDDNNNTISDFSDRPFPAVMMNAFNTITGLAYHTVSGSGGNYCFDLPPGNFIIKPVNYPLDSALIIPDSMTVNALGGGNYNNKNFGFRSPVSLDFNLDLACADQPRPGFNISLSCRVKNTGYLKRKGTLVLYYDPLLTPLNTTPASGIINTIAHTITWTTDSISPGSPVYYSAAFNIPASTPLGTLLSNNAIISAIGGTGELDLNDNVSFRNLVVIGSFDPNDKKVYPEGIGPSGSVLPDTRFDYRIRFQNTGTASAINIFVTDTIDSDLDLNTLVIHRASHNYDLNIYGRVITFRFFNINLPDSNTSEAQSHGFIEYSISPVAGLPDGTTFENTAYIYFDFNAPVITNTTINTIQSSTTALQEITGGNGLAVYPNPGHQSISLIIGSEISGNVEVNLYDISGKFLSKIYSGTTNRNIPLRKELCDLNAGVYIIELQHAMGSEKVRWINQ